jgi:hypothetical protein
MLEPGQIAALGILGTHKGKRVEELNKTHSNLVSGVFVTVNRYAPPPGIVVASHGRESAEPSLRAVIRRLISRILHTNFREDLFYELR